MSGEGVRPPGRVKEVTSLANPIVKDIRSLALKKFRDQQNAFLAEGLKLVIDALDLGWQIRDAWCSPSRRLAMRRWRRSPLARWRPAARARGERQGAAGDHPPRQPAIGNRRLRATPAALKDIRPRGEDVWVALDRVRDPGNLGTVIRTVDAVGAQGVILVGDCTDPFSLETVRATMGSIFAVPVARAGAEAFLAWRRGFPGLVAGTHLEGAVDYRSVEFRGRPVLLLMGNEQQGLPEALASACDSLLRIPQAGRADSLNFAVATGVMLFEIRRHALTLAGEVA